MIKRLWVPLGTVMLCVALAIVTSYSKLPIYHPSLAGSSSAFVLVEYSGHLLSETPKRKAVLDAIAAAKL